TMSVNRSTNSMGARCGSNFLICSTSRVDSAIFVPLAAPDELADRVNLSQPFSYRLCRNAAIILAALDPLARNHGAACRQPGARADPDMVGDAHLPAQHREIRDGRTARDPDLGNQHHMAADLHIVTDLKQIIDLGTLADHGIADRAAVDGGAGADFD